MIYLILAILSSALVAIVMRIAQPRVNYPIGLLAGNYLVCVLMALLMSIGDLRSGTFHGIGFCTGIGALNGLMYLSGFVAMQWNTRHNGVILSSIFMKLGVLVPTLASVLFFHELPTAVQLGGFLLAIAAILIINYQKGSKLSRSSWALIALLFLGGMGDTMSKVFEELGNPQLKNLFLLFTFVFALVFCFCLMAVRKEKLGVKELLYGIALGVPNFLTSLFVLNSLSTVPAIIVFPTFSVGVILVVALAGILLFREKLSRRQLFGCLLICGALVLLNI